MNSQLRLQIYLDYAASLIGTFFNCMDHYRFKIGEIFLNDGVLSWNGNLKIGRTNIQNFLNSLPLSKYKLKFIEYDCIADDEYEEIPTIYAYISGEVVFGARQAIKFQQSFVIIIESAGHWNISSAVFRINNSVE